MNMHSIRAKSSLPIAALAITLVVVFFTFLHLLSLQEDALETQSEKFIKSISAVLNADRDLYQAKVAQLNVLTGLGSFEENNKEMRENAAQVKERFNAYRRYLADYPDVTNKFASFERAYKDWYQASEGLLDSKDESLEARRRLIVATDVKFQAVRDILDKAGEAAEQKSEQLKTELESEVSAFKNSAFILIIIILLVAGWFSYQVPKQLTGQINFLTGRIREIASGNGDLTATIDVQSRDEFGELAIQFNRFVGNLRELIKAVLHQSAELSELTNTLQDSSQKTRSVTQTLNKASDSIVSAVHEMNISNKEMAQVASGSAEEAENSSTKAQQGISVVAHSNSSIAELSADMDTALSFSAELEKSSEDIASVLDVIRGIAEQTNLLALNAAIEAARAGEQGRGFAVVADEVRTLATRTQESTNHIQEMIEQLQHNVNRSSDAITSGKKNVDKTIDSFGETNQVFEALLQSAQRVNELSTQTAQATEEQSAVSDDISQNLFNLNEESGHATSIAESSESLAKRIKNLSENLNGLVSKFRV
ncbi:methyl-accepting chemotaxis protein [Catenovulum sediminis]|uniref:Methyl-accepting chemotaxis protein n=1 Tax=Catenovulum sediminis TaxID=1740262 RepID=A0ABV1REU8_9ALTE